MPSVPFFGGSNPLDALAAASLAWALEWGEERHAGQVIQYLDGTNGQFGTFPGTTLLPPMWAIDTPRFYLVVCGGTQNGVQLAANILGSQQESVVGVPGKVHGYFGTVASAQWARLLPDIISRGRGRNVVFIGHSLGGATAQILSRKYASGGGSSSTWTFGSPRVGNLAFANSWPGGDPIRYENVADPVPSLPPPVGFSDDEHPFGSLYYHAGTANTLFKDGVARYGVDGMSYSDALRIFFTSKDLEAHRLSEYTRRLRLGVDPAFFEVGGFGRPPAPAFGEAVASLVEEDEDPFTPPLTPLIPAGGNMPVPIRATFVFDAKVGRTAGWSENYWIFKDSIADALPKFLGLAPVRRAVLHTGVNLAYIRVSQEGVFRDSFLHVLPDNERQGTAGSIKAPEDAAQPFIAVNLRLSVGTLYRGRVFLRGVPSSEVKNKAVLPPEFSPAYQSALEKYKDYLLAAPTLQIYVQNKELPLPQGKIVAVSSDVNGVVTILCKDDHGMNDNDPVNIIQTGIKKVNGRDVVQTVPGNTKAFRLLNKRVVIAVPSIGHGFFWKYEKVLRNITNVEAIDITSRKVGRPFFLHRGRQSKRL
jgi:pimeloyl-ACP methyl ester carboxylesterase